MKNNQPNSNCYLVIDRTTFDDNVSRLIQCGNQLMNAANNLTEPHAHIKNCEAWEMRAKAILSNSFSVQNNQYVQDLPQHSIYDGIGSTGIADDFSLACQLLYKQVEYVKDLQKNAFPYVLEQPKCGLCSAIKNLLGKKTMIFITLLTLLLGFTTNVWGYTAIYLNGDLTGGNWNQATNQISDSEGTDGQFHKCVIVPSGDKYWRLYSNKPLSPFSNNYNLHIGDNGYKVEYDKNGEDSNGQPYNFKYTDGAGVIKVSIDQKSSNDEWRPYVWLSRPALYIKTGWNGSSDWYWSDVAMTYNNDGTYTLIGQYGADGVDWDIKHEGDGWQYVASSSTTGNPSSGDMCAYTLNFNTLNDSKPILTITNLMHIASTSVTGGTGGTLTINGKTSEKIQEGNTYSVVATASDGYKIKSLVVNGETISDAVGKKSYTKSGVTMGTSNQTSSVEYELWTVDLTINGNGGTPESQNFVVKYGDACPNFENIVRTGYTYEGCGTTAASTANVINKTSKTFKASTTYADSNNKWKWTTGTSLTIEAKWTANSIKIIFKKNGATGGTDSQTQTMTYDLAGNLKTIQELGYTRTGYDFAGWALTAGGEVEYEDGEEVTNLSTGDDVTLYAKWTAHTTTITLDRNYTDGGTGTLIATYDSEFPGFSTETTADYTRTGYTFNGYKANTSGSSAGIINVNEGVYSFPNSGSYGSDGKWKYDERTLTAFAYWTANNYTITLHYQNETSPGTENKAVTFDATAGSVTPPTYGTNVFNGYYTSAVGGTQIINADGAFLPNVEGYTSNGNWIKSDNVDLYAQWITRTECTITYGVTDGTQAVSTRGSINAKVGEGTATNTGTVKAYTGDQVTITYSPKTGQYYTSNNGYEANGWFNAVSGGSTLPTTHKNDYTFTVTGDASVYVKADPVIYTVSTLVNPANTTTYPEGAGTVTPASGSAGPDVALELTAAEKTGYDWVNWTLSDETNGKIVTGTATDKTISVAAKAAGFTATANFTVHNYTITYHPNNGGEDFNEQYTIEAAHTLANAPTYTDYSFDGWFDNENLTGDPITSIPQGTTGDKVYWAKWHETLHTVTINKGTGITSVDPSGERQVGNVNPLNISATVATGYTWSQWTASSANVTITDASSVSTTIKATGDGTVTATATEILLSLTTSANESYMGSVEKTASSIGVATTSQLTATATNRNYKFKQWNLTNCTITSGTVNEATITIKGDGINNPSAEAEFEVAWYVNGDDVFSGWGTDGHQMTEQSEGVFAVTINVTQIASQSTDFGCKIYNASQDWYYEYNNTEGDGFWFTRENSSTTIGYNGKTNMRLRSDMVGNYIFTLDCSTSRENPTLTVTFPTTTTYDVDIYYDGVTKTTVEGGAFAKSITANVPLSMRFDHWVVEGETTHVNIDDVNSQTTTFTASGEGAIIRAKFKVVGVMYLKASDVFGDAYVNFYSSKGYWDSDNSKGSGNSGSECMSKNNHMTKIGQTDIYYLDVSAGIGSWSWTQPFSFVNQNVNHENFSMCNVVYRSDYNDRLPLYVPRYGYITHYYINCHYYNDGIWMKYNDTYSGYKLWIKEKDAADNTAQDVTLNALIPGGYEFNTTLNLKTGTTYELKIHNENGEWYGVSNQTITATSCTNWHFWKDNNNCKLTTSEAGEYTFVLNLGSGEVIVSVEYPLSNDDYRVVAKQSSEVKWEGDLIKNSKNVAKKDTTSFFNNNYTYQLQQYAGENTWNDIGGKVTITDDKAKVGVINLIVTQDESGNATLAYEGIYTGNYYIRTDGVDGGWGSYKSNPDNKMDNYGSLLVADPDYQYDVYKAKWITAGKNVKFRIANDYSKAISDELKEDAIIDNKETLPQDANVRFMWNSKTNQLKRAYISGSTDTKDRYLVLTGDEKMFDEGGKAIPAGTAENHREGLLANELNFADKNNWVYQADIQAQPGCAVKLTANYNSNIQYFIGAAGDEAGSSKIIINSSEESSTNKYTMRVVYDFKTNRLVAGWIPSNTEITEDITLGGDMLITRTHQENAQQITFNGGSIADIKHIYGVLTIEKDQMIGTEEIEYVDKVTNANYEKTMYWISFPFKVKISEIFGVDGYGQKWIMQKYRGDLRAQKGWFKGDGTETFWEFMEKSDSLNAYEGYLFLIDANYFNTTDADVWKNNATEANFYFPSASGNIGIISADSYPQIVLPHECKIDREFSIGIDNEGNDIMVNHMNTDSHWNVIGVPAFQNASGSVAPAEGNKDFKAFYEWNSVNNSYNVRATAASYEFKTMYAYMTQFYGTINWTNVSVVTKKTAPRYAYADEKNYMVELFFNGNGAEDHTYINLSDEANTDFVLNEDMMKLDNAGFPNIYSFAGNYNVAYNETKKDNQTVMLGVSAPKNGNYTFSMPKEFSGTAKIVDLVEGITTDLNVSNYSVDLNKGTYNNRFQLLLEVEAKAPTSIEADGQKGREADGKTTKLLRNGNIYLINGGRVYNVLGVEE